MKTKKKKVLNSKRQQGMNIPHQNNYRKWSYPKLFCNKHNKNGGPTLRGSPSPIYTWVFLIPSKI